MQPGSPMGDQAAAPLLPEDAKDTSSEEQSHEEPVSVEPCACAKAPSADGLDGSVRIQLATHHSGDEVLLEQDRPSKGARHSSISAFSMASYKLPSEADYSFKATWKAELKMLMVLAVPCILANTSTQTMVVTDQIFVGHLGVSEFAAGALGNTWFNLLWAFMLGASTAMDTLASQAYGARDYRSLLVWTFAGLIVMTVLCFPIMVALYLGKHVASTIFHQDEDVAVLVGTYCRALIAGMWPLIWSLILMKFLQTQNCMKLPALIVIIAAVANVGLNFGLVGSLGFTGAPWSTTVVRTMQFILMLGACIYAQHCAIKHAGLTWRQWRPVAWAALRTAVNPRILWAYCRIALPGGLMNAFEGGAFDITTAFAGSLGEKETAAHAALLSLCIFCFNAFPFAVSIAGTIRVGNLLGEGRARQARLAGLLCVITGTAFQWVCGIVLGASRGKVARIFTNSDDVMGTVAGISPLAMAFQFSDGAFGTAQGVLRGMGQQAACVWYNVIGFWGFGVLVGWILAFKANMGLKGLWVGLTSGDVSAAILSIIAWLRTNWKAEAIKAHRALQQAAAASAATGGLQGELETAAAMGDVPGLDVSGFEDETLFFVMAPPASTEEALGLTHAHSGDSDEPVVASHLSVTARGISVVSKAVVTADGSIRDGSVHKGAPRLGHPASTLAAALAIAQRAQHASHTAAGHSFTAASGRSFTAAAPGIFTTGRAASITAAALAGVRSTSVTAARILHELRGSHTEIQYGSVASRSVTARRPHPLADPDPHSLQDRPSVLHSVRSSLRSISNWALGGPQDSNTHLPAPHHTPPRREPHLVRASTPTMPLTALQPVTVRASTPVLGGAAAGQRASLGNVSGRVVGSPAAAANRMAAAMSRASSTTSSLGWHYPAVTAAQSGATATGAMPITNYMSTSPAAGSYISSHAFHPSSYASSGNMAEMASYPSESDVRPLVMQQRQVTWDDERISPFSGDDRTAYQASQEAMWAAQAQQAYVGGGWRDSIGNIVARVWRSSASSIGRGSATAATAAQLAALMSRGGSITHARAATQQVASRGTATTLNRSFTRTIRGPSQRASQATLDRSYHGPSRQAEAQDERQALGLPDTGMYTSFTEGHGTHAEDLRSEAGPVSGAGLVPMPTLSHASSTGIAAPGGATGPVGLGAGSSRHALSARQRALSLRRVIMHGNLRHQAASVLGGHPDTILESDAERNQSENGAASATTTPRSPAGPLTPPSPTTPTAHTAAAAGMMQPVGVAPRVAAGTEPAAAAAVEAGAGGVAAMSTEQVAQMLALLQEELARRRLHRQQQ